MKSLTNAIERLRHEADDLKKENAQLILDKENLEQLVADLTEIVLLGGGA